MIQVGELLNPLTQQRFVLKLGIATFIRRALVILSFAMASTIFVEAIASQGPKHIPHWLGQGLPPFFGLLLFSAVWLMLWSIVNRPRLTAAFSLLLLSGFALASTVKFSVRGQPLLPNELLLVSEGIEMFLRERLPFDWITGPAAALTLALLLIWAWRLPVRRLGWSRRLGMLLLATMTLLGVASYRNLPLLSEQLHYEGWNPQESYYNNGFLLGFTMTLPVVLVSRPPGYGAAAVAAIASRYGGPDRNTTTTTRPMSLILILSESFLDPMRLPGVTFASDPAPTFHYLAEKYGRVELISPTFGGGTDKAEFEMLTGGNMLFLPPESYPYPQFLHRPTPSLASILRERGYATSYVCPYGASFYDSQFATQNLGFSRFLGIDKWTHKRVSGFYISDASAVDELMDEVGRLPAPFFIVMNTLEGHDPYTRGRYGNEEAGILSAPAKSLPILESYTIAIRHADAALHKLITRLACLPNPVMVVFYGDHLPRLSADFSWGETVYRQTGFLGDPRYSLEGRRVTAVFWTNTGEKFASLRDPISMCYFTPLVLERLGQRLPRFQQFLADLKHRYPVLSVSGCLDSSRRSVPRHAVLEDPAVANYRLLNYDMLFGGQYFWRLGN